MVMTREERCRLLLREIVDAWHHSIGTDAVRPDRLRAAIADAERLLAEPQPEPGIQPIEVRVPPYVFDRIWRQ